MPDPNPTRKRRSLAWGGAAVCVLAASAALYLRGRTLPENLGEISGGIVVGGRWYRADGAVAPGRGVIDTIASRPIRGGRNVDLVRWPGLKNIPRANLTDLTAVRGQWLYCLLLDDPASLRAETVFGPEAGEHTKAPPGHAGSKRRADRPASGTVVRRWVETSPPYSLMRIPIRGGTAEKLGVVRDFVSFGTNTVYWLDAERKWTATYVGGRQTAARVDGVGRLMVTSLSNGKTWVAATGLPALPAIVGSEQGVAWTTPRPGAPQHDDVHLLREGTTAPIVIRDVPENATGRVPVVCGDRIYWVDLEHEPTGGTSTASIDSEVGARRVVATANPRGTSARAGNQAADGSMVYMTVRTRLMSVALDGADRRVVLTAPILHLYVHKDRLYLFLRRDDERNVPGGIVRLHPERSEPMERIAAMPDKTTGVFFEEDYLYFTVQEQRRTWMERLTGDISRYDTYQTLRRIRLAD